MSQEPTSRQASFLTNREYSQSASYSRSNINILLEAAIPMLGMQPEGETRRDVPNVNQDEEEDQDEEEETGSASPSSDLAEDDEEDEDEDEEDDDADGGDGEFKPRSTRGEKSSRLGRGHMSESPSAKTSTRSARKSGSATQRLSAAAAAAAAAGSQSSGSKRDDDESSKKRQKNGSAGANVVEVHGLKWSSKVKCDAELLTRLLPLGTIQFNKEVKDRELSKAEVRELKMARRRFKNAKTARNYRSKMSESLSSQEIRIKELEEKCSDLQDLVTQLRAQLAKNQGGPSSHHSSGKA